MEGLHYIRVTDYWKHYPNGTEVDVATSRKIITIGDVDYDGYEQAAQMTGCTKSYLQWAVSQGHVTIDGELLTITSRLKHNLALLDTTTGEVITGKTKAELAKRIGVTAERVVNLFSGKAKSMKGGRYVLAK